MNPNSYIFSVGTSVWDYKVTAVIPQITSHAQQNKSTVIVTIPIALEISGHSCDTVSYESQSEK